MNRDRAFLDSEAPLSGNIKGKTAGSANVHGGHRKRLRKKFTRYGLNGLEEHELLELLLSFVIPVKDVNPLAHRIIKRFRGLYNVMMADGESLMDVEGVGEKTASFIKLVSDLGMYIETLKRNSVRLMDMRQVKSYIKPHLENVDREILYMICLDVEGRLLSMREVSAGSSKQLRVDIRKLVRAAVLSNAVSVVLVHNHINGVARPSPADLAVTSMVRQALAAVDITLDSHLIYAGGDNWCSAADECLRPEF